MMASACLYDNDTERKLHTSAIQMLAREFEMSVEEIQGLYETMLGSLKETARVKDFLAVLVSRYVKDMIKGGIRPRSL
jgi:hypothetical protein